MRQSAYNYEHLQANVLLSGQRSRLKRREMFSANNQQCGIVSGAKVFTLSKVLKRTNTHSFTMWTDQVRGITLSSYYCWPPNSPLTELRTRLQPQQFTFRASGGYPSLSYVRDKSLAMTLNMRSWKMEKPSLSQHLTYCYSKDFMGPVFSNTHRYLKNRKISHWLFNLFSSS